MGEVHYMISETAKRVNVETHTLHQWEEELMLPVGRTEMGHRFYTNEDIQLLSCIKKLKEQGMSSEELKALIPDLLSTKAQLHSKEPELSDIPADESVKELKIEDSRGLIQDNKEDLLLIAEMFQDILIKNNDVLKDYICSGVSEKVIKDMEFLLQAKERSEEERFRSLDHLIRQQQVIRRESAKATPMKRFLRFLGEV